MRRRRPDTAMLAVILTLAWPTMLEQLMQTAVQYIDTAMVGSLGTSATAAVGATSTVNWLVNSSLSALGVGFLAFIARALGAGEAFLLADALVFGAAGTLVGGLGLLVAGQRGLGLARLFRAVEFAVVDLHVVGRDGLGVFRVRLRRGFRGDVGVGLAEKAFDVLQQCVDVVGGRFFRSALLLWTQLIEVFHKLSPSIFRPV